LHIAQSLGDVEHQALSRLLRQLEIALGVIALLLRLRLVLLRDASLLDRNATLPVRETGQSERQHQTGRKAPRQNIASPRRPLPALPDEGLRLLSWRRCARRPRSNPPLRLL